MLSTIITFALGFAAGCSMREIIRKSKAQRSETNSASHPEFKKPLSTPHRATMSVSKSAVQRDSNSSTCGFNLASIEYLFNDYNIRLIDENSFSNLLRAIENATYKQTLQLFVEKATSPELLYNLIENETSKDVVMKQRHSYKVINLPEDIIDKLIASRSLEAASIHTVNEKVQLLLSFSVSNGLKSFQSSMGNSLEDFINKFQAGDDVKTLYMEIYNNIKDTYNYLT